MEVHIVQKGDTLWKISRQHGVSFEELKRVNAHLANPDYIVPGMKIFLPEKSKGGEVPKNKVEPPKKQEKPMKPMKPEKPSTEVEGEKKPIPLPKPPKLDEELPIPKPKPQPLPEWEPPEFDWSPEAPTPPMPEWNVPPTPEWNQPPEEWTPPPAPEMTPSQPQPQQVCPTCSVPQKMPFPMMGAPCGWIPIYHSNCCSENHHGHHSHQPFPRFPTYPSQPFPQDTHQVPYPFPLPTPQLSVEPDELPKFEKEVPKDKSKDKVEKIEKLEPIPLPKEEKKSEPWKMPESPSIVKEKNRPTTQPVPPPIEAPQITPPQLPLGEHAQMGGQQQPMPMPLPMPCPMPQAPYPPVNHCNACNQPVYGGMMPMLPTQNWYGGC